MRWAVLILALAGCEAVSEPVEPPPEIWRVLSIDGVPFAAPTSFGISPSDGVYLGQGPCNRFQGGVVTAPFPAVILSPPVATRMACPDLAEEARLFDALGRVERMGVSIDAMILSTLDGTEIVLGRI
ncbi:META domain-containing protein [Flavimaricola marinus]|uniref:META domain protein n=1 Tax=Flavimaricola marinus TaxID=1819565 RepID=A0A238LC12_9RHOB|nr:META domain-containing protein [Flavimaricola marinus]SMY06486.1 META domain protein [Flavimaricola marinus]